MRKAYRAVVLMAAIAAVPAVAQAQMGVKPLQFGGQLDIQLNQGSWVGVGPRVEYNLASVIPSVPQLKFIGSFDYFFASGGTFWELNGNVAYRIPVANAPVSPYAGGGIDIAHAGVSGCPAGISCSSTKAGLNLLGGVQFKAMGTITPFAEARVELRTGGAFLLTGGVLF